MMAVIPEIKRTFDERISALTSAVESVAERFLLLRRIELVEAEDGSFQAREIPGAAVPGKKAQTLPGLRFRIEHDLANPPLPPAWQSAFQGSRVDVQLQPDHVMATLLDFPTKAGDFLAGMIRA